MKAQLDAKGLEEVTMGQRHRIAYLNLDIRMTHIKRRDIEVAYFGVHDIGLPQHMLWETTGHPDIVTQELCQFIEHITLPENM